MADSPEPTQPAPLTPYGALPEGGTVRPITRWGTPVMHRPQEPVTDFGPELRALVADMVATMYAADGVGLAACQIGVDLAVFCFDCPDESGRRTVGVVCNPVVTLPEGDDRHLDDDDEDLDERERARARAPQWTHEPPPSERRGERGELKRLGRINSRAGRAERRGHDRRAKRTG